MPAKVDACRGEPSGAGPWNRGNAQKLSALLFQDQPSKGLADMYRFTFVLAASFLLAVPASHAADQATCADQFKAADLNNDGMLSGSEIGNAKDKLPAAVVGRNRVNRIDFMAACTNPI